MKNPKKRFLKLPEYPGGKEAFKKYIRTNMIYPPEALEKKIEGIVQLVAEIDDNGNVLDVEIKKGLGAGCDEEAVRLIKNVVFGGVKNRGIRLRTRKIFKIEFKLPHNKKIKYNLTKSNKNIPNEKKQNKKYSYTINLK
jgi:TonB family protein